VALAVADGSIVPGPTRVILTVVHSFGVANASSRHDEQMDDTKRGAALFNICTSELFPGRQFQDISARISRGN